MPRVVLALSIGLFLFAALFSLWQSPYLPSFHDQYQAERVYEMTRAIAFGQIPPRYVLDIGFGYGYPLFNFYGPFPYYIGAIFYLLGFDLIVATKIMFSLGFILAFFSMYYVARSFWGNRGGLISATLYMFAPYHAVQLYVRGSISEMYAYAFFPFCILFWHQLLQKKPDRTKLILSIIAVSSIFTSHTLSLYIYSLIASCAIVCVLFLNFRYLNANSFSRVLRPHFLRLLLVRGLIFMLPFLLTAYFWIPAFLELNQTQLNLQSGNDVLYSQHFVTLSQLWHSAWGYAGSAPADALDGMSFMLGKSHLVLALLSLILFVIPSYRPKHFQRTYLAVITITTISILLMLDVSQIIWQSLPFMNLLQFPWRLITIGVLCLSWLAGSLGQMHIPAKLISHYPLLKSPALFSLLFITLTYQLIFPLRFSLEPKFFRATGYYEKNSPEIKEIQHLRGEVSAVAPEYLYQHIPRSLQHPQLDGIECGMPCRINYESYTPDRFELEVLASAGGQIHLQKANFPGFHLFVNGVQTDILETSGRLGVFLPSPGRYHLSFQLFDTPVRMIANNISVVTICLLVIFMLLPHVKHKS